MRKKNSVTESFIVRFDLQILPLDGTMCLGCILNFYVAKNGKNINSSTTVKAIEKISTNLKM